MSRLDPGRLPLALYVHIPWCVRKCPYCDFNSHAVTGEVPERAYVEALLDDLDGELEAISGRPIRSVFIGGGTPSLFTPSSIQGLLAGIRHRVRLVDDCEITLEANPGTLDAGHYAGYLEAGVNRLSIGVQSLDDGMLERLGRIHGAAEARAAVRGARAAGFEAVNLDLMFGLPGQSPAQAAADLGEALELSPTHISYYQLTLEPNTLFHARPPRLPEEDDIAAIWERGRAALEAAGYSQYEVSAYAGAGRECRHNLNYWWFGDYVGIGAGAHGKLSTAHGEVIRTVKHRHPAAYLKSSGSHRSRSRRTVAGDELTGEFMLNALRIKAGVPAGLYGERTGLDLEALRPLMEQARDQGLLEFDADRLRPTELGYRFLNRLVAVFLD